MVNWFNNTWYRITSLFKNPYFKAAGSDIVADEPLTDKDAEFINVAFARKVREAVRWLHANNPDIGTIIGTKTAGVIGAGVNIQSRIKNRPLLNEEIEEFIKEWSEAENCEVTGRWHLNGAFRAMQTFVFKDGGILIRHHINPDWEIPYRFQLLEVGMIDVSKNDKKNNVLNGIKKDKYGRMSGIYIYDTIERTSSSLVDASEIIYYSPVWVSLSQYTAVSKLASILPSIEKLDKYSDAELQSAIERAKSGVYWFTEIYDVIMDMMKAEKDKDSAASDAKEYMKILKRQGVKASGLTPLPHNDKIEKPSSVSDSVFSELHQTTRNTNSAATGQAGIITNQDPSRANYSAMKGVMAITEINWSMDFDDLQSMVIDKIMRKAITAGVASGKIKISGYFSNPRKYQKLEYMRLVSIDIEPSKTAEANQKNLDMKITSERAIARKSGRDIMDIYAEQIEDEIRREQLEARMRKEAGLAEKASENAND